MPQAQPGGEGHTMIPMGIPMGIPGGDTMAIGNLRYGNFKWELYGIIDMYVTSWAFIT